MTQQQAPPITLAAAEVDSLVAQLDRLPGTRQIANFLQSKQLQAMKQLAAASQLFDHDAAAQEVMDAQVATVVEPEVAAAGNRRDRRAAAKNGKAA